MRDRADPGQLRTHDRHRLSRGGDRHANAALHHIVKNRMTNNERTRAYRDAPLAKGALGT